MEELRVNQRIRIREVRLINDQGEQVGIVPTVDALRMASEQGLDLVEISPTARPPVCKLMDYGKFKYESEKREKEAKKKQHVVITKEIKLRPKIGKHDMEIKSRHIQEFLADGCKVRVTMLFRGREMAHQEIGRQLVTTLLASLVEHSIMEQPPKMEGIALSMLLAPKAQPAKPAVKPAAETKAPQAKDSVTPADPQ
jgi:translation initiation factor IF-3